MYVLVNFSALFEYLSVMNLQLYKYDNSFSARIDFRHSDVYARQILKSIPSLKGLTPATNEREKYIFICAEEIVEY